MANSTVTIYRECRITPDKNFLVENITQYLSTLSNRTFPNFQYIKHGLSISIKIDTERFNKDASELIDPSSVLENYNYCEIKNSDQNKTFYYFIVSKGYMAENTVVLNLALDSINTFELGTDYTFDSKTKVTREHKDRIYNSTTTYEGDTYYRRKIDFQSEGVAPVLYKKSEQDMIAVSDTLFDVDHDWYLMYKADNIDPGEGNIPKPVSIYMMADSPIAVTTSDSSTYTIPKADILSGYYYIFGKQVFGSLVGNIKVSTTTIEIKNAMALRKELNGTISIIEGQWSALDQKILFSKVVYEAGVDEPILVELASPIYGVPNGNMEYVQRVPRDHTGGYDGFSTRVKESSTSQISGTTTESNQFIDTIDSVDRSNSTILKIIKLPYCPFDITFNSQGRIQIPSYITSETIEWVSQYTPRYLKVSADRSKAFEDSINTNLEIFHNLFTKIENTDERNDDNESKLYHSDYYENRFVYDSFSFPIQYENIKESTLNEFVPNSKLEVKMVTTSTPNSRFLFDFQNIANKESTSDYDHIMIVNRNSELPVFNSEYVNYMKTGYNYDVKNKNAAIWQGAIGIASGTISTAAGMINLGQTIGQYRRWNKGEGEWWNGWYENRAEAKASGVATPIKNPNAPPLSLATLYGAGQIASGISGIASGIGTILQAERSFKQKQEQIKQSSASVAGSDDIDLLSYYSNNRAKVCEYKVSDRMKDQLADLFYYCGYSTNEQKSPDVNTRRWFNYLMCEADLNNEKNIDKVYLDDLIARYSLGVTILHDVNTGSFITTHNWDFDQEKANNEVWLYN